MRALLCLLFVAGCAQPAPRADATAPLAGAPPLEYRSAFADFIGYRDDAVAPWRDANEAVKEGQHK